MCHPCMEPLPTETGQPEMGAEFAHRMAGKFILLGPGKRKKGGEGATKNSLTTADSIPGSTESDNTPLTSSGPLKMTMGVNAVG